MIPDPSIVAGGEEPLAGPDAFEAAGRAPVATVAQEETAEVACRVTATIARTGGERRWIVPHSWREPTNSV